jgi:hypothetical protein
MPKPIIHIRRARLHAALLALVPMVLAVAGGLHDEASRLGYSNWRTACRSAGFSPGSLISFTLQLLPTAVIGALIGGLLLQISGVLLRRRHAAVPVTLAAHAGCLAGMAGGLALCALALPLGWMLAAEGSIAAAGALAVLALPGVHPRCNASVSPHALPAHAQ